MSRYAIKPGYRANTRARTYRDSPEHSRTYQVEVYRYAARLAQSEDVRSVLDIGCGLGTKLMELVAPHCESVTGLDAPNTIDRCRAAHPGGRWVSGDIGDPEFTLDDVYDLIISADVIEHLREPDRLLELARAASHESTRIVLSTPERDLRRGPDDMGPPGNPTHVREWNREEFAAYLESRDFTVRESLIVELCKGMRTCQLVLGRFEGAGS